MKFSAFVLALGCALSSCQTEEVATNPKVLVSGEIVHVRGPYTYEGDFVFTEDAHASVTLFYSSSAGGDAPAEQLAKTTLDGITAFPLTYQIEGDPKLFSREGDYFLQASVLMSAGDEHYVGDLLNEVYTPVYAPGTRVQVEVTGLEHCDSPGAGGFCTTKERP